MRNLVPPNYVKSVQGITYTDSEKAFIKKYGENALYHWRRMTDEQKADYEELEEPYSDFVNLFTEHYEDLKLYAIMYRNVPLYNIENDIYSILYFASHRDEIMGYKEKLMSDKTSPQAQVALLYSENEALFPKFCIKYANVNFQPNKKGNKDWALSVNSIKNFRDGKIPPVFSVNDLTVTQCNQILANKGKIPTEYSELCDKYLGEWPKEKLFNDNLNEADFARKYFVSLILEKSRGKEVATFILEFVKNKIPNSYKVDEEIKNLNIIYNDIGQTQGKIINLFDEKRRKEREIEKRTGRPRSWFDQDDGSITNLRDGRDSLKRRIKDHEDDKFHPFWFGNYEERKKNHEKDKKELQEIEEEIKRLEEMNRQNAKEIAALEEEIKKLKEQVEQDYFRLSTAASKTNVFRIIYNYQKEVEDYVGKSYEMLYNKEWLNDPAKMRRLEPLRTTTSTSLLELMTMGGNKRWITKDMSRMLPFCIMREWCEAVEKLWDEEREKEREEQERKRKEEEARTAKYRYNQINAHPRDAKLSFDKGSHIYTVGGRVMDSVTTIIKNSFPEFDKKKWAPITAKKKGMTEREVLDMWEKEGEESREKGTLLHEKIESYYQGKQVYYDDTFRLFENMAKQVRLSPYRTEWAVYDYDLGVAGTVDFVDYQNGQYALYDWKRSEKVIVNGLPAKTNQYGEKGNYPIGNLDNTPYWHYALQLSMYKYILEHNYGMEISRLRLGVFHPSYIKPYLLEMPYLEKEVNAIFSLRSEIIF